MTIKTAFALTGAALLSMACLSRRIESRPVTAPAPRFPDMLRSGNIGGTTSFVVTIDSSGRAAMSTFEIATTTHDLFASAVRQALPRWRWRPDPRRGAGARFRHTVRWVVLPNDTTARAACPSSGPDTTVVCAPRGEIDRRRPVGG